MARKVQLDYVVGLEDRTRQPALSAERNIDRIGDSSHAALGQVGSLGTGGAAALGGLGGPAGIAAGAIAAVGLAAVKAGQAFARMISDVTSAQRELLFLSESSGIGIEALSVWGTAFEHLGGTVEDAGMVIRETSARIGEAWLDIQAGGTGGEAGEGFRALGLDIAELVKLDPAAQFERTTAALNAEGNAALRSALANQVLSDQYAEMLPLILRAGEAYDRTAAHAAASGKVITEAQAEAAVNLQATWAQVGDYFDGFRNTLTELVAGPLTALFEAAQTPIRFVASVVDNVSDTVAKIIDGSARSLTTHSR